MKKSKILTLSATMLMALTAVGCNPTSSSTTSDVGTSSESSSVVSSSEYSVDEILSQAATTLWTMYKDDNNSYI